MEQFKKELNERIKKIELSTLHTNEYFKEIESQFDKYLEKAKETVKRKQIINPKPKKRIVAPITEDEESENDQNEKVQMMLPPAIPIKSKPPADVSVETSERTSLRPSRTAKSNAQKGLKEVPSNVKMRNDNNTAVIFIKQERISNALDKSSRDSLKENDKPKDNNKNQKPRSPDEIVEVVKINSVKEPEKSISRSNSVEIVSTKPIEIDVSDESIDEMPPPALPVKKTKTRTKKNGNANILPVDPTQPLPMRVTRSKIKTEKQSLTKTSGLSAPLVVSSSEPIQNEKGKSIQLNKATSESILSNETRTNETIQSETGSKKGKKKYPMPILVKIEPKNDKKSLVATPVVEKASIPLEEEVPKTIESKLSNSPDVNNQHQSEGARSLPINETVTISSNLPADQTVTLATYVNNETVTIEKSAHDSLMTDDNDDDTSMNAPLAQIKKKNTVPPPLPLKLKKNEVFNPYLQSPVKQKVQAFEKHATKTPDKSKGIPSKFNTLKAGTPSKIATYSKTTPLNNAKQKYMQAVTASASSASSSSAASSSTKKPLKKKFVSLSHDSTDSNPRTTVSSLSVQASAQLLEEKKKQREEKQRQVQLQREAIEKQKREQVLQQQREREEKFRKMMQDKEDQKKLEVLKKKQLKENQEKKYAEEKARKEEPSIPKPHIEPSSSKDESLYLKMQKQLLTEKSAQKQQKKVVDANTYSFDMLLTDDSTDDESSLAKKRPDPPQWSKKPYRKKQIIAQSYVNSNLLDALFSVQAINVNLKELFPAIEARKLIRNSSAVWNTPPRYSQMPKY